MKLWLTMLITLSLTGCATAPKTDVSPFVALKPRSILVLPPLNDSPEVEAPLVYLSTISKPFGELGYYVLPVALTEQFLRENGAEEPYDMHQISHAKLRDIFGADLALYVRIQNYGQRFLVLNSVTEFRAEARLVHLASGKEIWSGTAFNSESSNATRSGNILEMFLGAALTQIADTHSGRIRGVVSVANYNMLSSRQYGIPPGPYYPDEEETSTETAEVNNSN